MPSGSVSFSCTAEDKEYVAANVGKADPLRGGLLYDAWWKVAGVPSTMTPVREHPLWVLQATNARTGSDTWRCAECHGWDYKGKDGAYGSGDHYTGFRGVFQARTKQLADVFCAIKSSTNHAFGVVLYDRDILDLTRFILAPDADRNGVIDLGKFVNVTTRQVAGDGANGASLFSAPSGGDCYRCHGELDPLREGMRAVAADDPWQFLHKVRFGDPGSDPVMPSYITKGLGLQSALDIAAYVQANVPSADAIDEIVYGARLYDDWIGAFWFDRVDFSPPSGTNPLWTRYGSSGITGSQTWRCKSCHGWDYKGKDGINRSGSFFTGIKGVYNSAKALSDEQLASIIVNGFSDPQTAAQMHNFGQWFSNYDIKAVVKFIRYGVANVDAYIDPLTSIGVGDEARGKALYESRSTDCEQCHYEDGRGINFGDPSAPEYVGTIAVEVPWTAFHRIRFGTPDAFMEGTVAYGLSTRDAADILTYAQTLPVD